MGNNEEFNVNINVSNRRITNTNKPTIECNKRKILLPQSCNDEPISKHSKVEKNNISCKPISSLLDNNFNNETRLVDSSIHSSEIRTTDIVNVSESEIVKNKLDSNSKNDNTHTKKYTDTSEHTLNFSLPPHVTTVYAKVASHPDTNTSMGKDCLNYASVPSDKVVYSMPNPYVKNSPKISNSLLQNKSKGTPSNRIIGNPEVNKNVEKHNYSKSNKQNNVSNKINEKSPITSELLHSRQNIESFVKKSTSCNLVKDNINSLGFVDINKIKHTTTQSTQIQQKSYTNIINSTKTSSNNLIKICESSQGANLTNGNSLEFTKDTKIISEKVQLATRIVKQNPVRKTIFLPNKEKDKLNVDQINTNQDIFVENKNTGDPMNTENANNTKINSNLHENHKSNSKVDCIQPAENCSLKTVETTDKNNVENSIQIINTLEMEKATSLILDVKNSSQKDKSKNKCKMLEHKQSLDKSDQSKSRECNESVTSQEEFMKTVQLKPISRLLPKIIDYKPKNQCTKKIENICLNLEAKISQPQENINEKPIKKCSKKEILKKNKNKPEKEIDVEHNINMLASVALSIPLEADEEKQSPKCTKVRKSSIEESFPNSVPIRLTRNSSNQYDKDEVNEDFAKATNTNIIKTKRKTSIDSKACNSNKKVKEDKSENTNTSKCENDSRLATKVTSNGNKSIDNLTMVLWEMKNIKTSESFDTTMFSSNKMYNESVTSTPKQICSKPEDTNCRDIKKEDTSIDDKIAMNCSVIVEDLVRKNLDEKNDSHNDEEKVLLNNFNFDENISSFVNRLNLDKIFDTSSKESEVNLSLEKTLNSIKLKDDIQKVKDNSLSNIEHNKKEVSPEFSELDIDEWFYALPSPTLDCELPEFHIGNFNQTDNISPTTNTISSGDRLISGYNDYISSKHVGHSNNVYSPFDFYTTSDFFELEYSQHNSPEQTLNGNTNNELINEINFLNSEIQPTSTNSLQLNPNEFLNLSTESVIEKLESSKTSDSPNLEVISLEEMKIMPTDNILKKAINHEAKPSVEELKKQINEKMAKEKMTQKITQKNDTPSKLSRRMHKVPSGTNKKIKLLKEEENISITKNSESDNRNLNSVFPNNGSLPSLIDDDLLPPSCDLKNKLPITDNPNSQSLSSEKISKKSDTDEIFNKLKNEENNITVNLTKTLPTVKLTPNSLITLKNHDKSASIRNQKYDQSQNSLKSSSSTTKPSNIFFKNSKKNNLSNISNCPDNKIKLSTICHPNAGDTYYQQIYSDNRRKTDPNKTHSNIKLSDLKSNSQSSNSICCRSTTPPNKKKKNVYAPIGYDFEILCRKKIGNEITAAKK